MTPRTVGRYEIEGLLGRGGMGSVHLARQQALGREVALKELHSVHVADAALAHRFLHESRVAGGLNHPSIVSVIEYFEPAPSGPPLAERLGDALAPALLANSQVSDELLSLAQHDSPDRALRRVGTALPATADSLAAVRELRAGGAADRTLRKRAERALATQADYLDAVRAALKLRTDDRPLDSLSSLLASRLERIEPAAPNASESVRGVRELTEWVAAETAVEPTPTPSITATPTPAATASPGHAAPPPAPRPPAPATARESRGLGRRYRIPRCGRPAARLTSVPCARAHRSTGGHVAMPSRTHFGRPIST